MSDADATPSAIPVTASGSHSEPVGRSTGEVDSALAEFSSANADALPQGQSPLKTGAIHPILSGPLPLKDGAHPLFAVEQLGVDRRLIVNRKRQLKMYRVWMQGKFRKV